MISATLIEQTEEEWKILKNNLQPIHDELLEESENSSSPQSLISEEDTIAV